MAAPRPLTLCPPAQLDWNHPKTPAATNFGDIYFSTDGGLAEAHAVFLEGCGLPQGWQSTERFVIGELGFGSGLNFLATWDLWNKTKPSNGHLHFVSIEKFPFDKEQLTQALCAWPELSKYSEPLIAQWPGRVRGFHRLHFGDVTLTLIHDDIQTALDGVDMCADAWFLDGFSPNKNPDMWSPTIMAALARLSAPGARLATFSVAGTVRQALTAAGFAVERRQGFGRKRHRLEARLPGKPIPFSYARATAPLIIGAGIGGISLAKAFLRRGVTPVIKEDPHHIAASGNPAALIKPRFDLQDRPESRFFLSSYLYALAQYRDAALSRGITHLPKSDSERERNKKLIIQQPLPPEHLTEGTSGALELPKAMAIDPLVFRQSILDKTTYHLEKVDTLPNTDAACFMAIGFGIKDLFPNWPVRFSRGQLTWGQTPAPFHAVVSYGGYALPLGMEILVGATHNKLIDGENPFVLHIEDDRKNLIQFEESLNLGISPSRTPSRASVRVTTQDTLPVIGRVSAEKSKTDTWVLTGLGSRGFVFAPLLAESVVSYYFGDPLPIDKSVWRKFSAKRFWD